MCSQGQPTCPTIPGTHHLKRKSEVFAEDIKSTALRGGSNLRLMSRGVTKNCPSSDWRSESYSIGQDVLARQITGRLSDIPNTSITRRSPSPSERDGEHSAKKSRAPQRQLGLAEFLAKVISHLDCLKLPNGEYTKNKATKSLEHLMETHFLSFQVIEHHCTISDRPRFRERSLAAHVVQPKGVEWAVKTFNPYKSPNGPDGIYLILLQERLSVLLGLLTGSALS